ncbi:hypothetical protein [Leptospira limi]|uniref:Lipoprotein n=1 Tax=Leptospira limi TaxID=2950023 RepID=A0ABT3M1Y3_9LEPT|nr:hypothetical protein [Leptospira limi]MCW7463991.1 hypothetical protein [Leptospira limi]
MKFFLLLTINGFLLFGCNMIRSNEMEDKKNSYITLYLLGGGCCYTPNSLPKSGRPEFIGDWKNVNYTDACNQTTINYIFDDTIVSLYKMHQVKDNCNTINQYNLQLQWKVESSLFCQKVWLNELSPWNCYSYNLNSSTFGLDNVNYLKQ